MSNEELFLNRDFDTLYTKNMAFVYRLCNRYSNMGIEYDELIGCADLAFTKSIKTFNPTISKWLTYYSKIICNEILMLKRRLKRYEGTVSLQDVLSQDVNGHVITIEETICSGDLAEEAEDNITKQEIYALIKQLKGNQKEVIILWLQGQKQTEIARTLGVTQSYVSRLIVSSISKLKDMYQKGA